VIEGVDRDHRRGLCEPIAFQDQDPDRMEEFRDILGQGPSA